MVTAAVRNRTQSCVDVWSSSIDDVFIGRIFRMLQNVTIGNDDARGFM